MRPGFRSGADAIAEGFERGAGIALGAMDRRERAERQAKQDALAAEDRAIAQQDRQRRIQREDRLDARQMDADADAVLSADEKALAAEFESTYRAAEGDESKIDPARRAALVQRQAEIYGRRRELNERRLRPIIEQQQQRATKLFDDIKAGRVRVEDVPDDELYRAVAVVTRRKPEDFLRPAEGGGDSPIGAAVQRLLAGIEQSDPAELASAANIILAPELQQGVGTPGRDGSIIVKKEIERFLPAPNDPGRLLPVLRVHVRRADGATGSYLAPVTKGRSADGDDDEVVTLPLDRAMEYTGQQATLAEFLNAPGIREKLERGAPKATADVDEFLAAYQRSGAKPYKRKLKSEQVRQGDKLTRIVMDEETGKEVDREEFAVGIDPTRQYTADTAAEASVQRAGIAQAGADRRNSERLAAGVARGTGASGSVNIEAELRRADEAGQEQAARALGLVRVPDPISGRPKWMRVEQKNGKESMSEPSGADRARIERAGADAREQKRRALDAAGKTPESRTRAPGAPAPAPAPAPAAAGMSPDAKAKLNEIRARNGLPPLP